MTWVAAVIFTEAYWRPVFVNVGLQHQKGSIEQIKIALADLIEEATQEPSPTIYDVTMWDHPPETVAAEIAFDRYEDAFEFKLKLAASEFEVEIIEVPDDV